MDGLCGRRRNLLPGGWLITKPEVGFVPGEL